jgi:D-amino peptidase
MNIYIMVDAEGISGIYDREQVMPTGSKYDECRMLMTEEINTCVEAAKEAGVEKIFVRDSHGGGNSVIWDKLSSKADYYISGKCSGNRFPGIEECDGVILLGYHAMAGTPCAILEHTMSSETVQNYWLNGQKAGEVAVDAAVAGDFGKPVIMVSGDDKVCLEAKTLLPWIVTAEVKKGLRCFYAMLLPKEKAKALLREKVKEAIKNLPNTKPYVLDKPVKLRIEKCERSQLPYANKPYIKIIDGRTYEVEGATMEEALYRS